MKLLPRETFTIDTALSFEQVAAALANWVEPKQWFRFGTGQRAFEGTSTYEGFEIARIIGYRNSFIPIIRGTFAPGPRGMCIAVTMSPHVLVRIFMTFWFAFLVLVIVTEAVMLLLGKAELHPMMLIPLGVILIGWTVLSISFWIEVGKAKALLEEMFGVSIPR